MGLPAAALKCFDSRLSSYVTPYCFADLSEADREVFEIHLLSCEACWREVDRLSSATSILRSSPTVMRRLRTAEVVSQFGMSSHLERPLGGHVGFGIAVGVLYGLLHAASVWTELAYSYGQFAILGWLSSAAVFAWVALATCATLSLTTKWILSGNHRVLSKASLLVLGSLAIMTMLMWLLLPQTPTIEANFATRSAAAGFFKNEVLYFVPLLLFILPTFHAVVSLQVQLRAGRFGAVLDVLTDCREGVAPRGVWLVPTWFLVAILLVGAFLGYAGTNHLLDNLKPSPYSNTFTAALYIRVSLWFVVAMLCFAWYQRSIQELRREAIAASRLVGERRR